MDDAQTEDAAPTKVEEPTLSPKFGVNIQGWENDNEAEAKTFAESIYGAVRGMSRVLDLSRLESVVIAWDYQGALAAIDRGGDLPPATPTSNEYGEGGAMAVHVLRDDEPWNVVVIWTPLVRRLLDEDHPEQALALHTFVHELVHVSDLRLFTRTYPGGWKAAKPRDGRDGVLQAIVNPCQSEYSAQRRSAWAAPAHGLLMLDMLGKALVDVDEKVTDARIAYRLHGDMDVYWPIVTERYRFLFQSLGYGLGHADWIAAAADEYPELAAQYEARLAELRELPSGWLIEACREAVQPFYELATWSGPEVYDPLIAVVEDLLNRHGMFTSAQGEGIYVDMPMAHAFDL